MEAALRHHLLNRMSLAVTLLILSLGLAMIAWEWRNARTAAPAHAPQATHQHRVQSNPSDAASADHQ